MNTELRRRVIAIYKGELRFILLLLLFVFTPRASIALSCNEAISCTFEVSQLLKLLRYLTILVYFICWEETLRLAKRQALVHHCFTTDISRLVD